MGRLAWGTQFHIETTPETVQAWADEEKLCADQARYWQTIVDRYQGQTDPLLTAIAATADKNRSAWTVEDSFAGGQAVDESQDSVAG